MVKSVIKEIILVLLLCLAIILVLGIGLYKYIPVSKTLPSEVAYTMPTETKEELTSSEYVDNSQIVMTYTVNASDLNNYQRTNNYKPGRANPFASYEKPNEETSNSNSGNGQTNNNTNTNTNSNGSTVSNNNTNSTSEGHFFQDTGTK